MVWETVANKTCSDYMNLCIPIRLLMQDTWHQHRLVIVTYYFNRKWHAANKNELAIDHATLMLAYEKLCPEQKAAF